MSKPKRITDGWYIFEGGIRCFQHRRQVVRVLQYEVLIAGSAVWWSLDEVKANGTFIERIDLYNGRKS